MPMPLCPNCISGHALQGEPRGSMETLGDLPTYVSHPSSGAPSDPSKAVIFLYDAFGLLLANNKLLPDYFADQLGVTVYVPDLFLGGGMEPERMDGMPATASATRSQSLFSKLSVFAKMATKIPWFLFNLPKTKFEPLDKWVAAVEGEKGVQSWAAVGYCYGGAVAVHLNQAGKLKACVLCHPSMTAKEDYQTIKAPTLFLCAEEDMQFGDKPRNEAQEVLKSRGDVEYEFKVYEEAVHGFAARPDLKVPQIKAAFEDAGEKTVEWFKKYLLS